MARSRPRRREQTEAIAAQLAATLRAGRRRARLRRARGGQDDVRARRVPRARGRRRGDEPDVHDRAPLRRRPRAGLAPRSLPARRAPTPRIRRCWTTSSGPNASTFVEWPEAVGADGAARRRAIAARVRLEHRGPRRRAHHDRAARERAAGLRHRDAGDRRRAAARRRRGRWSCATIRARASGPRHAQRCCSMCEELLAGAGLGWSASRGSASASGPGRSRVCASGSRPRARWRRRPEPSSSASRRCEALAARSARRASRRAVARRDRRAPRRGLRRASRRRAALAPPRGAGAGARLAGARGRARAPWLAVGDGAIRFRDRLEAGGGQRARRRIADARVDARRAVRAGGRAAGGRPRRARPRLPPPPGRRASESRQTTP